MSVIIELRNSMHKVPEKEHYLLSKRTAARPNSRLDDIDQLHQWATHDRQPFYSIALEYVSPDTSILDIGAGAGDFARLASKKGKNIHLIDGNPETVASLRREFSNTIVHNVPDAFPYEDGTFNVVHCSHLVEHLSPQDFYSLLCEIDRILAVDGVFVVSAPLLWSGFYDDLSHVRPYPPSVFEKYMVIEERKNATRSFVPGLYAVHRLQYRYKKTPPPYFDISSCRQWAKKALFWATNVLRRMAFAKYEVSGFTMVLKKVSRSREGKHSGASTPVLES